MNIPPAPRLPADLRDLIDAQVLFPVPHDGRAATWNSDAETRPVPQNDAAARNTSAWPDDPEFDAWCMGHRDEAIDHMEATGHLE